MLFFTYATAPSDCQCQSPHPVFDLGLAWSIWLQDQDRCEGCVKWKSNWDPISLIVSSLIDHKPKPGSSRMEWWLMFKSDQVFHSRDWNHVTCLLFFQSNLHLHFLAHQIRNWSCHTTGPYIQPFSWSIYSHLLIATLYQRHHSEFEFTLSFNRD